MARRSATECAGIIDICNALNLMDKKMSMKARAVLLLVVAMLTKMTKVYPQSQASNSP